MNLPSLPRVLPFLVLFVLFRTATANEVRYEYASEPEPVSGIASVEDLSALADRAGKENAAIMIEFSTAWCEYCEALERQVLRPMILSGEYEGKLIIRKLEANDYSRVTGFDGKRYVSEDLALNYNISLYPTLVFFDPQGREIGRRIVGITVLEYVGREIENAVAAARKQMR